MKAALNVSITRGGAVSPHMIAVAAGLRRCGVDVREYSDQPDLTADFCVTWGTRRADRAKASGAKGPFLIVEHGYLGDRINTWTSLGWDGLNGRARFPEPQDGGQRFWSNHGHLAKEWECFDGYWLIAGQVLGDQSLNGVNYKEWLTDTIDELDRLGVDARFRPHPEAVKRQQEFPVPSYMVSTGTLEEDLSEAACVIAYNSNATVDAVLAGIPAITCDEGAMAWDVTSHHALQGLVTPDRTEWFRRMAWTQYLISEIQSGFAWDIVKQAMFPRD